MLESITDYLVKIGGPIVVISGAMFFVLRHYVTERIKSDFAKQLEDVRQKNQTAIEVLRDTMQRNLESLKSSLEISRSAARILIERRFQFYETFFETYNAVDEAGHEMVAAFATTMDRDPHQLRVEALNKYYLAFGNFDSWEARSRAFVPKALSSIVFKLRKATDERGNAIQKLDFEKARVATVEAVKWEIEIEKMVRADLDAIQKSGSLPDE